MRLLQDVIGKLRKVELPDLDSITKHLAPYPALLKNFKECALRGMNAASICNGRHRFEQFLRYNNFDCCPGEIEVWRWYFFLALANYLEKKEEEKICVACGGDVTVGRWQWDRCFYCDSPLHEACIPDECNFICPTCAKEVAMRTGKRFVIYCVPKTSGTIVPTPTESWTLMAADIKAAEKEMVSIMSRWQRANDYIWHVVAVKPKGAKK
jgi:hypothetical protein